MDKSFNFYMPAKVISGKGILKNNADILSSLGRKCMIVTGKTSAKKSGVLDELLPILEEAGIEYILYDGIEENPKTSTCFDAAGKAAEEKAEYIIGIGGGSALDAAKAIALYTANPELGADDIYLYNWNNKPIPVLLIGTTSGTGSEVTGVSVLTRTDGRKQSVSGPDFYASYVIADSRYTYSMPYITTVSTALDAFCHAAEAFFSKRADYLSREFSLMAAKILVPELKLLDKRKDLPSEPSRDNLYHASLLAGLAINKAGTCFPHGMSYALTEDYLIPHGLACAVFLPAFLAEAQKGDPEAFSTFIEACSIGPDSLDILLLSMTKLGIAISEDRIEIYRQRWDGLKNFRNSPTDFDHNDAANLLKSLFT
ncbi:MAG: iron-containing alcohol dehydrogenase [Clostridiales bacterium]|nr:iron-containing alcohol dehydrogenase [Clostridiales bacterium]